MTSLDQKPDIQHHEIDIPSSSDTHSDKKVIQPARPSFFNCNPAPIGFSGFALCSFVLGLFNSGLITDLPQVAIGVALGFGAMSQFVCGVAELALGNVFSATSMLTFSGFFFAFGIMMTPSSGFLELAMASGGENAVTQCMALVEIGFAIAAFIFLLGALRQPYLIQALLFLAGMSFFLAAIGSFVGSVAVTRAGGWFSFILGCVGWYCMAALLYTPDTTYIKLPFF
jgi:succinate-acetate transporter protein